jgi:hypothetical protein
MLEVAGVEALKRMAEAGVAAVPCIAVEREAAAGCLRAQELDAPGNLLGAQGQAVSARRGPLPRRD